MSQHPVWGHVPGTIVTPDIDRLRTFGANNEIDYTAISRHDLCRKMPARSRAVDGKHGACTAIPAIY